VNLTQLIGTMHNICKGRNSNSEHPTYSPYKDEFLASRVLDKNKKIISLIYVYEIHTTIMQASKFEPRTPHLFTL